MVSYDFEELSPGKRRSQNSPEEEDYGGKRRRFRAEERPTILDVELHLETPFPAEGPRCFHCKHADKPFLKLETDTETWQGPRKGDSIRQPPNHELNLLPSCPGKPSLITSQDSAKGLINFRFMNGIVSNPNKIETKETEERRMETDCDEEPEMIATVCARCHMLVMLCKISPKCPNCKFMHSTSEEQRVPKSFRLFNSNLVL